MMRKPAARWPDGKVCNSCFYDATQTYGSCPGCGTDRLLPGRRPGDDRAVCRDCARIRQRFECATCRLETRPYRKGNCARCALRLDLEHFRGPDSPPGFTILIEALCSVDRPESILTWKRNPQVQELLRGLGSAAIPMTHVGLDAFPTEGRHVGHLRAILVAHGALPARDKWAAVFERWIDTKLATVDDVRISQPVRQFATWHHLNRINEFAAAGKPTNGPVHASKQEITQAIAFLTWLRDEHSRTIGTCTQQDLDQWIAAGPSTRYGVRTFIVWCAKTRINKTLKLGFRQAKTVRILTQEQRLEWIRELLTGESESLPYRVAGSLLLLYAQPLVRVVNLRLEQVLVSPAGMYLDLGGTPAPVPGPFADMLREHINRRPNLRTANADNPWIFPSTRAGEHLHTVTVTNRLRTLGIDLLGARNAALRELVSQVPAPVVADMLGYSNQVTQRHADLAAQPWSQYANLASRGDRR